MLEKTRFFNTLLNSIIAHIKSAYKATMADKLQILDKKAFQNKIFVQSISRQPLRK